MNCKIVEYGSRLYTGAYQYAVIIYNGWADCYEVWYATNHLYQAIEFKRQYDNGMM